MRRILPAALCFIVAACQSHQEKPDSARTDTLVVFTAASLAAPMRAVLDTFAAHEHVIVQQENGASLELARRITALGRTPDVIALADQEVFPELLVPAASSWYAAFARNRMVVAYTDHSRHASELTRESWRRVLTRRDVMVGRSDPAIAPVGYRALLTYALAERFYHEPGLAQRLEAMTPPSHMRGNATELAALLKAGELDYIVDYESLAKAQKFRYLALPPEIDLGDPAFADFYSGSSVRVARLQDSVTRRGAPILYALSVPRAARHRQVAERFLGYMLGKDGAALLRSNAIDVMPQPVIHGDSVPATLKATR